jgi:hypothetical protein
MISFELISFYSEVCVNKFKLCKRSYSCSGPQIGYVHLTHGHFLSGDRRPVCTDSLSILHFQVECLHYDEDRHILPLASKIVFLNDAGVAQPMYLTFFFFFFAVFELLIQL